MDGQMQQSNAAAAAAAALYDHPEGGSLHNPGGTNDATSCLQGYGAQSAEEKQKLFKLLRNLNLNGDSGSELYTPTAQSSGAGAVADGFFSPELREFGAGLLDLHAMDDTELLSEGKVMANEVNEDVDLSSLKPQLGQASIPWKEMEQCQSQVDKLETKLIEVKASLEDEEDGNKELNVLWRRTKATSTLVTYLKSKARMMAVPHLAHTSCGIRHEEGVGLVDKNGTPLSGWSRDVNLSSFDNTDEETWMRVSNGHGSFDEHDGAYIGEILMSVRMVTDVMEVLVKRVLMAETETAIEKEKVNLGQEEIKKKASQIESMSSKVEEMERFAQGTNCILNEMRQKVEDMVLETSRQRQRAAENEQELCRVKQDFESLRSYVSSLISVRETLLSSEKQFQTIERLFERLVVKTSQLESEKVQKEAEVQKLMAENVRLSALLDKKEAQLVAMNEQCKVMALNASGI